MMDRKGFEHPFGSHQAWVIALLLLSADLAFMAMHTINALTMWWNNPMLNIEKDHGYPETFQYLKYFWASILCVILAIRIRTWQFLAWALLFIYLLADDSLTLHEQAGATIAAHLNFTPPWGLRTQDVGELVSALGTALVLFVPLALAFVKGSPRFRLVSLHLTQLVLVLASFGVLVDLLHMTVQSGWRLKFILAFVEDGGEMIAASALLVYTYLLCMREGEPPMHAPWNLLLPLKSTSTFVAAN
jgi:hypothetical protein